MTPSSFTILVAEDDEDDFFFTARMLKKARNASVVHVGSGRAAIDYLSENPSPIDGLRARLPDLMLLDLKMVDVDGHEVLSWIHDRGSKRALKIFVLTGSGEPRDRERVKLSGVASGYFVKPLSSQHLAEMFNESSSLLSSST